MNFTRAQASRILKIPPQRLAAWERRGLLEGDYDFDQLSRARELVGLMREGVAPERLPVERGSVGVVAGQPVLADEHGLRLPDGQGVLDFRESPSAPRAHPGAARFWLELGDARQAVELDPQLAEGWHLCGLQAFEAGQPEEARDCWARLVELRPHEARARYNLGLALEDCGQLEEATRSLLAALELDGAHAAAHFNLARLYEQLERPARARWHWQASTLLDEA